MYNIIYMHILGSVISLSSTFPLPIFSPQVGLRFQPQVYCHLVRNTFEYLSCAQFIPSSYTMRIATDKLRANKHVQILMLTARAQGKRRTKPVAKIARADNNTVQMCRQAERYER